MKERESVRILIWRGRKEEGVNDRVKGNEERRKKWSWRQRGGLMGRWREWRKKRARFKEVEKRHDDF